MLYNSAMMTDARGSIGGITASRNRGGNYFRKRIKPTNAPSTARSRAKGDLSAAAQGWAGLTDAQRAAWNEGAMNITVPNKIGVQIHLSGINWFVKINSLRAQNSLSQISTPPVPFVSTDLTPPTSLVLDVSAKTLAFNLPGGDTYAGEAGGRLNVYMSTGQSAGVNSPVSNYTLIGTVSGNVTPITTGLVNVSDTVRTITNGNAYFVRFRAQDAEGRVSIDNIQRVLATP